MGDKWINNPAAGSCSLAPPPPWIDLPADVTANILKRLGTIEILESAQKVCATWWRVCKEDPSMWRVIDMKNSGDGDPRYLESLCLCAVDRSHGELIEIDIEDFCTEDTLRYISDRSPHLKRIRIAFSDYCCGRDLTAAVKKLPELEELHLVQTPSVNAADIETISCSCPMLKLLTFNNFCYRFPFFEKDGGYALVVAENMLNLRDLQFVESIKDLRRSCDSTADYESDDDEFYFGFDSDGENGCYDNYDDHNELPRRVRFW